MYKMTCIPRPLGYDKDTTTQYICIDYTKTQLYKDVTNQKSIDRNKTEVYKPKL